MYQVKSDKLNCSSIGKVIIIGDSGTGKTSIFNKLIGKEFDGTIPSTIGIDFHSIDVEIDSDKLSTKLSSNLEKLLTNTPNSKPTDATAITGQILSSLTCKNTKSKQKTKTPQTQTTGVGIRLQLWDAAGQERFRSIVQAYYRNSSVILLVFDLTNRQSFDHIEGWINQIHESKESQTTEHRNQGLPLLYLIGNKNDLTSLIAVPNEEIDKLCDKYGIVSYHLISAKRDDGSIRSLIMKVAHELYFHFEFVRELENINEIRKIYERSSITSNDTDTPQPNPGCCLLL